MVKEVNVHNDYNIYIFSFYKMISLCVRICNCDIKNMTLLSC